MYSSLERPGGAGVDGEFSNQPLRHRHAMLERLDDRRLLMVDFTLQLLHALDLEGGVDVVIAGGSDTILADSDDVLRPEDVESNPRSYPILTTNQERFVRAAHRRSGSGGFRGSESSGGGFGSRHLTETQTHTRGK